MIFRVFALISLILTTINSSFAAEHEVTAAGVKFKPMAIAIEPGDSITWTNMPAHLIESIDVMVPEGTEKILSELGVDVTYTFEKEGIYVYKCTPHWGARMGGVIMVGHPENAAEIIEQYRAEIEKDKSLLPAKGLLKKFEIFLAEQQETADAAE